MRDLCEFTELKLCKLITDMLWSLNKKYEGQQPTVSEINVPAFAQYY
jgi:hypothetical protein